MVGLLGQKIDWVGEDEGWYCLISDGEDFQLNVRVTAPMPEEFPDRQLVTGVSLLLPNGASLVVEVKDPYTIETDGCVAAGPGAPCLADGALRILVDSEDASELQTPGENIALAEGVHVSATNLPAECRPFGGDLIWAAQFEQMTAARRSLRAASRATLYEWILEPDTLAAPAWCAEYMEHGLTSLFATQSNHATLRIETPTVDIRINIGTNHQELVVAADGSTVVPELEFWQTDLGLEWHRFSDTVGGMLGDTSRFVFDAAGNPIREGLGALHAPVESYRVSDALGVVFEQLNK